jgi:hypothetical protein
MTIQHSKANNPNQLTQYQIIALKKIMIIKIIIKYNRNKNYKKMNKIL